MQTTRPRSFLPWTVSSWLYRRSLPNAELSAVMKSWPPDIAASFLALDLRREFATEWNRFLSPVNPAAANVFEFELSSALFPLRDAARNLKVKCIAFLARCTDPANYTVTLTPPLAAPPPIGANAMTLAESFTCGGLHFGQKM
jgi:hypothetical protein